MNCNEAVLYRMHDPPQAQIMNKHCNVINNPGLIISSKEVVENQIHGKIQKERIIFRTLFAPTSGLDFADQFLIWNKIGMGARHECTRDGRSGDKSKTLNALEINMRLIMSKDFSKSREIWMSPHNPYFMMSLQCSLHNALTTLQWEEIIRR